MGAALCAWLPAARYPVSAVVSRRLGPARTQQRRAQAMHAWRWDDFLLHLPALPPALVLLALPDDALAAAAGAMAAALPSARGWTVIHTSGARGAAVLAPLHRRGAAVGAMHPMMTFARPQLHRSPPSPAGVVFSLEGDAAACRRAAALVAAWRGLPLPLSAAAKTLYHLAATLVGPGTVVEMAVAEALLRQAGLSGRRLSHARAGLQTLLQATVSNLDPKAPPGPAAWTGPWARGDAETVALHWRRLSAPAWRRLYAALMDCGLALLPSPHPAALRRRVRHAS